MEQLPVEYVVGDEKTPEKMGCLPALGIFSPEACDFLEALSRRLLSMEASRDYPDVVTFAFWCRRASLRQMAKRYEGRGELRYGRGVSFHIAPSNVAVNFAYSFGAALLAGNGSIVRLPSRPFPQTDLILSALRSALEEHPAMKGRVSMVRYGHEKAVNDRFSSLADVRIIWGGDRTIEEIRSSPLRPRAKDIAFADRFSLAVIRGDAYLKGDPEAIAKAFYDDTYLTDQNACTSPRVVIWMGEKVEEARDRFWQAIHDYAEARYTLPEVRSVEKLTKACLLGAAKNATLRKMPDNLVTCVEVEELTGDLSDYMGNCGFFLEYRARGLQDILPLCGERCQTVSCYGISSGEMEDFVREYHPKGIDRVVPMGRTMEFDLVWDGMDLILEMSRILSH